ncbi:NUDIX domain-containing protein [Actinomadura barringtoniae]|uniref:NUDIX domain-containing protein n=1 Tax=Actinomadura barringtoniae TaxID=1427535 RepID=A0A939PA62_9ACTN|nr:NUDIX domain-containing protein [Actinomadura barringtoniae]MBO2448367.1 NUDIX domain-containing protein [Actinomadura barringtoniae]
MRWIVHSEEPLYRDEWLDIRLADVEITGGRHLQHRVMRSRSGGAGAVVLDEQRKNVLLIWRHRFITDTWAWEIPVGGIKDGEEPEAAAAREVEEETGWRPGPMRLLTIVHPTPGISDARHHIFLAAGATHLGPPVEDWEAERIEWVPLARVRDLVEKGDIVAGTSVAALCFALLAIQA